MNVISNLKTPAFYTVAIMGVIYYLERKKNVPVLDNFGIVAEKCIGSIKALYSKVTENKNKENAESVLESK
jgi:predicted solute-binding protein